jgi:AcrR family transcriptional regulator
VASTLVSASDVTAYPLREFGPTEERILVAALGLIGRRGVRRLGMQEMAEAAGVSRGTLYRYFPSKDHVLSAAADYDERRFRRGIDEVLDSVQDPAQRIGAFMAYAFDFIRSHPARSLFETEPGFVMSGALDRGQLADVIVRLFASSWLIPESDDASLVHAVNRVLQIPTEETDGN